MLKKISIFIVAFILSINFVSADTLDCNKTLKRGSRGENVRILQEKLNQYMSCSLEEDGIFGSKTYACAVKFQDQYGLTTDGIVGKNTCSKLNSDLNIIEEERMDIVDGNYLIALYNNSNIYIYPDEASEVIGKTSFGTIYYYEDVVEENGIKWFHIYSNNNSNEGYIKKEKVSRNFIVVDISEQRLIYFKNKKVILDTNVVTGMKNKHDTPVGHYTLRYANKVAGKTLRGKNDNGTSYASYVDYWMPFITDRGIGFHDATWRSESEFNDSTYIYDGSHGCVNMIPGQAQKLYKSIKKDTDVIIKK